MNIYSGIDLLVALMEKFKIPEMNGRAMLPPEEETRSQVNRTQIFLAPGTIEVDANDLELWVNPETGFFEVNGVWGAAYRHTTYNAYVTDVEQLPKWHISMCSTLSKYLANGDLAERYALKSSTVKDNDFVLSVIRLAWRIANPPPPYPPEMKVWEVALAKITVVLFYALMLGLPFSGWFALAGEIAKHPEMAQISVFGLFNMPIAPSLGLPARAMHGLGSNIAIALIGLHILAALKHQFMDDVDSFGRMRPQ